MNPLWVDIIGWLGGLLVVIAYFMNTTGRMDARNTCYQLLNLSGSIFLIIKTAIVGAYPSTAVNVIWVFIAISGLIKSFRQ